MGMSLKQRVGIAVAVLVVLLGLVGAWFFLYHVRTPDYALAQIEKSFAKQDEGLFLEYVDLDGVLESSYSDFMGGFLDTEQPGSEEARTAVGNFAQMVKEPLLKGLRQSILAYVRTGSFVDASAKAGEETPDVSTALAKAGIQGTHFVAVDGVEVDDASEVATALVRVQQDEAAQPFVLRVRLEPGANGRYRVTGLENFHDFMVLIGQARQAKLAAYVEATSAIVTQHARAVQAAEAQMQGILAAGSLGSNETRAQLKALMLDTVVPDWEARKAELEAVEVPAAAQALHNLRLKICDLYIGYAKGYAAWLDDKNAATLREAENLRKQAKVLEDEEKILARRMGGN